MLNDRRQSYVERVGQVRDRLRALAQYVQYRAACGISESVKHAGDVDLMFCFSHSSRGFFLLPALLDDSLTRQFLCQSFEQGAPSSFAHFRAIRAFEERSLMGADQVGSIAVGQKLNRD